MSSTDYITTVGLEVHAQLLSGSKMFCGCPVEYGSEPNTRACPVCLGFPGALPVLNRGAIGSTILTGLMLNCRINPVSKWDRKNYFYPDMPKDYQLSQYDLPLCVGGGVALYDHAYPKDAQNKIVSPGKVVKLDRIHLEEDVAKSTHLARTSSIDFNRAGTPLMEIVSEPDLDSAEEAVAFLGSLRQILVYGGVSDADMEKGQMRCDVNISVRPVGTDELGAKIELKNLNSISAVRRAIYYEVERQVDELERGIEQVQSTRRWDDDRGESTVMRSKEDAHDYRYFPEPDLLPVHTAEILEEVRSLVPELPHEKVTRFEKDYGVGTYDASVLSSDLALAEYFEQGCRQTRHTKKLANWVINNMLAVLNEQGLALGDFQVKAEELARLVELVEKDEITGKQAKEVFAEMAASGRGAEEVVAGMGFEPMAEDGLVDELCDRVIAENPGPVAEIQGGNGKAIGFLVGQVMKLSEGRANPKSISGTLRGKLDLS